MIDLYFPALDRDVFPIDGSVYEVECNDCSIDRNIYKIDRDLSETDRNAFPLDSDVSGPNT